jgi:pyruvate formate lyase activating enzyme
MTSIELDGTSRQVPGGITVKEALESLGFEIAKFPTDPGLLMPCQTGGCWTCALEIDGQLRPACVSQVEEGMKIKTDPAGPPKRLVGGFMPHRVGGVGTPWWLKGLLLEVACFTAGCNLRCPQCQNWTFTYMNRGDPLDPVEAARIMTAAKRRYGVDRLAISGGECTLNRRWLVQYLSSLRDMNPGANLHVDTNGSILTGEYLDGLVEAGMTDIGIDLKAARLPTFMSITGLEDPSLAERYMETAWMAVEHLLRKCPQVFVGIGIPYNRRLTTLDEVEEMGERILSIDPWVQVCVLDYRPEFKRFDLSRPGFQEMARVHRILRGIGLESVLCQTERGRIGPDGTLLP